MTRIATNAASQTALMDLMRAQRAVYDAQQQVTSGKIGNGLKGVGHRAETLSAVYTTLSQAAAYEEAGKRVANKLEVGDLALNRLAEAGTDLRLALTTIDGTHVMNEVRAAFDKARNALSTQYAGAYLFGGTRADTPPIAANSLGALAAAANVEDIFANSSRKPQVKLDDHVTVETGQLASEIGHDLMAAFKRITEYNAGPDGPFDGPLTDAQQAYLAGEIAQVLSAVDRLNDTIGENGALQSRVENLIASQSDKRVYLNNLIGGMEDVDMAEALSRLQRAQTAVDVSAMTFSTLSQVSLLPFLMR